MRLIDADELSEVIKKQSTSSLTKGIIEQFIKSQPTAYDVDKVVERLEEIREEILTDTAYDNDTVNYYLEYADLMIEDVKVGGNKF